MKRWNYAVVCATLWISSSVQAVNLSTLYKEMIDSYPGLTVADARVAASNARARQAQGSLLPQISFNSSFNRTRYESATVTNSNYPGERYTLSLTQSLFDQEKSENKKLYNALADQSYQDYLAFKAAMSIDLVERYVQVLAAEDRLTQVVEERLLVARELQRLQSMYKRQLAVLTDVLEVEARLDGLEAQEISAENNVNISREGLAEFVGREVLEPLDRFYDTITALESDRSKSYWTDLGLAHNHTLKALQNKISAVAADVKKASAGHLPTLSLQLSAQKSNIGFDNSSSSDNESYVAALNLSIPIFSGGTTTARQAEKRAELLEAEARYQEERRRIVKDIRESYLNVVANKANIKASKRAIKSSQKSYEAMSKGFEFGTVTVIDVLDAQQDVLRYRNEHRQHQYDYSVNWLNLLRLSGQLDDESIVEANSWLTK